MHQLRWHVHSFAWLLQNPIKQKKHQEKLNYYDSTTSIPNTCNKIRICFPDWHQKQELPVATRFLNGSGPNVQFS